MRWWRGIRGGLECNGVYNKQQRAHILSAYRYLRHRCLEVRDLALQLNLPQSLEASCQTVGYGCDS